MTNGETTETTAADLRQACEQRAATYGLLSRLYRAEADAQLLDELHAARFRTSTGNANVVNSEAEQRQAILDYGCEITVLTEEQIKAFQDVLVEQGYYEYFYNKYGADAFEAFGIDIESLRA